MRVLVASFNAGQSGGVKPDDFTPLLAPSLKTAPDLLVVGLQCVCLLLVQSSMKELKWSRRVLEKQALWHWACWVLLAWPLLIFKRLFRRHSKSTPLLLRQTQRYPRDTSRLLPAHTAVSHRSDFLKSIYCSSSEIFNRPTNVHLC